MTRDPARLRSNFEPGSSRWAVRRDQWRALGLDDADVDELRQCARIANLDGKRNKAVAAADAAQAADGRSERPWPGTS